MQLQKLVLTNFQGIKSFTFEPNGQNASVYGTNAAGKTTLYNSLTWLLFDKASTGEKGFSPKTKDSKGNDLHYLEHSVEGIFRQADGRVIIFKKVLKEDWKKVRGSVEETFSGHKTEYYVDGVPVLKYDYDNRLSTLFTPLQAQVLTQPTYFPEVMSWQDRRKLLLEMCGDVSDEDVIRCNEETLGDLPSVLLMPGTTDRFYTVDEYRKIAAAKGKELNEKIDRMPDRIDEAKRAIPDITGINATDITTQIETLKKQRSELESQKAAVSASSAKQTIMKEMADYQIEILRKKSEYIKRNDLASQLQRQKISDIENAILQNKSDLAKATAELNRLNADLIKAKADREKLSSEYILLRDSEWKPKTEFSCETMCPACGQAIPEEKIAEARRKFDSLQEDEKAKFNLEKANRLENIRSIITSTCSKDYIAQLERDIEDQQDTVDQITGSISHKSDHVKELYNALPKTEPWENTSECVECNAHMDELKKKLEEGDIDTTGQKNEIQEQINRIQREIDNLNDKQYKLNAAQIQEKRIQQLESEQKALASEYERIKRGLYLCEEFIRAKVALLTDKINCEFETVKFKLFEDQINGGLKECCEVMTPTPDGTLVPYSSANNAARINAGLELINTMSRFWGLTLPVFVDNAESVVSLLPIAAQVIRLVVSEYDKTLRTEV